MPIERLRSDLERLREEIAHSDSADGARLERLQQLVDKAERDLEAGIGDRSELVDELAELLGSLEASYPRLAAVINNVLVTLGSMGV